MAHSCKYTISSIHQCPNIVEYIKEIYQKHDIFACDSKAKFLPAKMSAFSHLSHLSKFEHPFEIEYLGTVFEVTSPFKNGWKNYQTIWALCPSITHLGR